MPIHETLCNVSSDIKPYNKRSGITGNELVMDLLATHPAHELSAASLCEAGALVGLSGQSVRVTLTRLLREGKITSPARGLYAWNPAGNSLYHDVENWIAKERRSSPWQGGWIGVLDTAVARRNKPVWRAHERALRLRGFERLFEGLSVRPNNLVGGVVVLRSDLNSLGLAAQTHVFEVGSFSDEDEQAARALWNRDVMIAQYAELVEQVTSCFQRLETLLPKEAAAESLLFGRGVIREIVRDPLLPEELVPGEQRLRLINRMHEYQAKAIRIWFDVLGSHGVHSKEGR